MKKQTALTLVAAVVAAAGVFALARAQTRPPAPRARAYVIPHFMEKAGKTSNARFTFDTTIFMTYTPGLAGLGAGPGATVDLYVYDQSTGVPMRNNGQVVCQPCTVQLNAANRFRSVRLDDLITARGGQFDAAVKLGYAVLVVGGADPDGVNLQGFITNSRATTEDLSVFGFEPQPILATAQ